MKVGNQADRLAQLQQTKNQAVIDKKAGTAGETLQRTTQAAAAGVPVTVSESARSLGVTGKNEGDMDMAKIRAMREAIANGTFSVNAGSIADKLLSDASDFLRPVTR